MFKTALKPLLCCLLLVPAWNHAGTLDDPMRPSTRQPPPAPEPPTPGSPARAAEPAKPRTFSATDFPVTQIYVLGDTRRALIQGEWHEPGDRLADARITDILPDAVVVMHGDLMHMLYRNNNGARFRRNEDPQ